MSIERNKQIAREFFGRFTANDVAGAVDMLSEDLSWWIAGKPGQLQRCGMHNKKQMARLFEYMTGQMENGLAMAVKGMVAEGDKVAVEVESLGTLRNGRVYNNEYHTLLTIRDDKICAVREYLDTFHVHATWFEAAPAA